jgi:hypothetical protein
LKKQSLKTGPMYRELSAWCEDQDFLDSIKACVDAQKKAAGEYFRSLYTPNQEASSLVSEAMLEQVLAAGSDVHGISRQPEISNVIVFNALTVEDAVMNKDVLALRNRIDDMVARKVRETFDLGRGWGITCSGHFWYPPGGYMGWHTNSGAPDWRLYISYAEEPDKSFFRYRDPDSLEIITEFDRGWAARLFHVTRDRPLWHAVYSDTNRFSLGYRVHPWRPLKRLARKIKGIDALT